jgi:hypothetical protein
VINKKAGPSKKDSPLLESAWSNYKENSLRLDGTGERQTHF